MNAPKARVVLVASNNLLLLRLRESLNRDKAIVVGETVRWEEAAQIVARERPEAILMTANDDAAQVLRIFERRQRIEDSGETISLTPRQREVIALVVQGLSNRKIGEQLGLAELTVRHYLTEIFQRLHVNNRLELLIFAHQHGIARLD